MQAERVVHGYTGIRVGDGRDIGHGTTRTSGIALPARLRDVRAAATARATPHRLAEPTRTRISAQRGPTNGGHVLGRRRELGAIAVVTRAHRDRDTRVVVMRLLAHLARELGAAVRI